MTWPTRLAVMSRPLSSAARPGGTTRVRRFESGLKAQACAAPATDSNGMESALANDEPLPAATMPMASNATAIVSGPITGSWFCLLVLARVQTVLARANPAA
jgi:hypothetical protein